MKKKLMGILIVLLLLAGVGVLLYPVVASWISGWNQSYVVYHYDQTVESLGEQERQRAMQAAKEYNAQLGGGSIIDPFSGAASVQEGAQEYQALLNVDGHGVMGWLSIPKIHVNLPIYHGTSGHTLAKGVGHLVGTALPVGGEGAHSVLTGHSGLPESRLLNDLSKLELGDEFSIRVLGETLTYAVDQIEVVEPSDTEGLLPVEGKDYVTLVTCTPVGINSHRLLVRGVRTQDKPVASAPEPVPIWWIWLLLLAAALLLAALLIWLWRRSRKKRGEQE